MAVTIVATVGGASANSFVLLSEAATYMEARLNASLWDAATTDSQNRALVEATRELSNQSWQGARVTNTQALSWPRQWVQNPDEPNGWLYDSTVIPQRVKDATMELAFQFLNLGTTDLAALDPTLNVRVKTVDVLSTEYFEPYQRAKGLARFPRVMALIRPLLQSTGSSVPLVRG